MPINVEVIFLNIIISKSATIDEIELIPNTIKPVKIDADSGIVSLGVVRN